MYLLRVLPALAIVGVLTAGCGGNPQPQIAPAQPAAQPASNQASVAAQSTKAASDPVTSLIAVSEGHFKAGERELAQGHLDRARIEFDKAVTILLDAPEGARTDARMRDHFDRLVDRISALEVVALAEGDGFTEKPSEPASIDELLAVATFQPPVAAAPETKAAVSADLLATLHDVPIALNDRVLGYIELFQGRLRGHIQSGLDRGSQYLPMIHNVLRSEGLPLDLAYIPLIESAFKPSALSHKSAKGVWQFMKGTGLEHGLKTNWFIDERSDPEKATIAAAKYLKTLHRMFGDWHLALASYNGGPGRVQRAMERSGHDGFWDLTESDRYLPRETREYVPMILAAIVIAKNPASYGFEVASAAPLAYDKVTLAKPMDLRRIAEWTGTSIESIQQLNPELRRWTTPLRSPGYEVKVPAGRAATLRERLAAAPQSDLSALNWHRVKRGESLATIARKLKVSRGDLAEANGLSARSRVRAGQELIVPRAPTVMLASRPQRPAPTQMADARSNDRDDDETRSADARIVYRVKRGDTLSSIARVFDTSVAAIKSSNRLRSSRITPGDRLTILTSHSTRVAAQ